MAYHVSPRRNRWVVHRAGTSRATRVFRSQAQAIVFANDLARRKVVDLYVHGQDGRVQDVLRHGRRHQPG